MIGVLQIPPSEMFEMTLIELNVMYRGYMEDQWYRTSAQMATVANCHRGPDTSAYSFDYFSPFRKKLPKPKGESLTVDTLMAIKNAVDARNEGWK